MYIMLVDDESSICNGLTRMILRKWPSCEVVPFTSSVDALNAICERVPDLLITDIRMPELDGLNLIEKGIEKGLENYAVLTGYDEFTLAQRAIKLKTLDYLLKPVDIEQLYGIVTATAEKIRKQEKRSQETRNLWLRLLCQTNVAPEEYEQVEFSDLHPGSAAYYWVLALFLDPNTLSEEIGTSPDWNDVQVLPLGYDLNQLFMVLFELPASCKEEAKMHLERLKTNKKIHGFSLLPASLEKLRGAYFAALENRDADLQTLVGHYAEAPGEYESMLIDLWDRKLICGETVLQRFNALAHVLNLLQVDFNVWEAVSFCSNFSKLDPHSRKKDLRRWLNMPRIYPPGAAKPVLSIIDYIHQNYKQELTLQSISEEAHVSPSYFSALFHQNMEQTLTHYVNRIRINYACLMLIHDSMKSVNEIADQSGYQNAHYFFKVFKNLTGMTPGEFRQLIGI